MFTGIVAGTAPIVQIEDKDVIRSLTVDLEEYTDNLEIGASVALDGVCMTVVSIDDNLVKFDAIEDLRGQWDHPNRCTMIPASNITMKNVGYPVLGIDDTGYKQIMQPEQDYTYPGTKVFEIPITAKYKPILTKLNNYIKMD